MRKLCTALLAAGTLALAGSAVPAGAATATPKAATVTTVTSGLDNPRGLAFLPNGTLAVAEAGHGGDVCIHGGAVCIGATSQVSTINLANGTHTPLVTGLFSLTLVSEGATLGAGGLSVQGGRLLAIEGEYPQQFADVTCSGQPSDCPQVLAAARATAGTLAKVTPSGHWHTIAGVGAFDYQWTVDQAIPGAELDSNPYGLLGLPGRTYVADAGSNTLDSVGANGRITVLHRFPNPVPAEPFPTDGVPTCAALTPSGQLYVADLAGRIWRMANGGTAATQVLPATSGLHFTGCAADPAGNVYFVSIFSGTPFPSPLSGSVVKLTPTGAVSTVVSGLNFPNKPAIGSGGSLYVSVNSVCPATPGPCGPATGSVVRISQ
jgi:hypothetical protein